MACTPNYFIMPCMKRTIRKALIFERIVLHRTAHDEIINAPHYKQHGVWLHDGYENVFTINNRVSLLEFTDSSAVFFVLILHM